MLAFFVAVAVAVPVPEVEVDPALVCNFDFFFSDI